jgi:hypothetical protein
MTGVVLALAGLTAGDGGQSAGAARAPVEMTRRDRFRCCLRVPGRPLVAIVLSKGRLSIRWRGGVVYTHGPVSLTLDGGGRFRLTCAGATLKGAVSYQGPRMVLNVEPPLSHSADSDTRDLWNHLRRPHPEVWPPDPAEVWPRFDP